MVDLLIIGGGPGGYETALKAATQGLSVVLIEKNMLGGTCLHTGCIPTKTLYRHAEVCRDVREASEYGLDSNEVNLDFKSVMKRKESVIDALHQGILQQFKQSDVELIYGEAKLIDAHTVRVDERDITAKNIIIAVGSKPALPPIQGIDLPQVITSKELLEQTTLPKSMAIIGGGVIGMEFAAIYKQFGVDIQVFEFLDHVLPYLDTDLGKRLAALQKRQGITIKVKTQVTSIEVANHQLKIKAKTGEKESETTVDQVLIATGRIPAIDALNLDAININYTKKGISVNDNFQTNHTHIYAIGDVIGGMMLAHAASFHGEAVLAHILKKPSKIRFDLMPSAVFTFPEIASVGKTESELKINNTPYTVKKTLFKANGKAVALNDTDGFAKLIIDENSKIIGAHLIGPHVSDLIHEMVTLMHFNATIEDAKSIIHAHPTLSEILMAAFHE